MTNALRTQLPQSGGQDPNRSLPLHRAAVPERQQMIFGTARLLTLYEVRSPTIRGNFSQRQDQQCSAMLSEMPDRVLLQIS